MAGKGIFVIDLGTSKVHANLIDPADGKLLCNESVSYPWRHPCAGQGEILSECRWEAAQSACEGMPPIYHKSGETEEG